jgi:hypothetical protein
VPRPRRGEQVALTQAAQEIDAVLLFFAAMKTPCSVALALALVACAAPDSSRISDAAATPLSDLNLVHAEIPAVLVEARKRPYLAPVDQSCAALAAEVRTLDEVLGADLDVPASASNPSLIERGGTVVGDAAVGAFRGAAEGVVPFRGWVRKLTGAERYSKEVAAAITAGTVRRAFLKGVRLMRGCA